MPKKSDDHQLAIINPEVPDDYLICKDTLTIHPIFLEHEILYEHKEAKNPLVYNSEFPLNDDSTVRCKLFVCYAKNNSTVKISFLPKLPPNSLYEISLYYVKNCKLVHEATLCVENVLPEDQITIPCRETMDSYVYSRALLNTNETVYAFAICIKISRKDSIKKKSALLLSSQITDCSLLFENSALTNFSIIVENKEFKVHKEILAAKSTVFLAMFESEMKEKMENQVTIEEIEADVFYELLRYIYTNTVNDLNVYAEKLLMVANRYDVPKLRLVCIGEMARSLTVENAVGILKFAERHNLQNLKDSTIAFIKDHIKSIIDTEDYKALYKSEQGYLVNEITQALINSLSIS